MFPYGDKYEEARCHDRKAGLPTDGATAFAPGSAPECHGIGDPYASLLDLSGGLSEWTARCPEPASGGLTTGCLTMGGSGSDGVLFSGKETTERLSCWTPLELTRLDSLGLVGIRCCADD